MQDLNDALDRISELEYQVRELDTKIRRLWNAIHDLQRR